MPTGVTIKPTFATVAIVHNSVTYPTQTKDLMQCRVTLSCDNKAGDCDIVLENSFGTYDNLFVGGDPVSISLYKAGGASTQVFGGIIDDVKIKHVSKSVSTCTLHAIDWSWLLLSRLVSAVYITLDPVNNPGPTVDQVVIDLINNPQRLVTNQSTTYNFGGLGLTAASTGSGGYVQPSGINIQNKTFYNQPVNDCLQELANIGLANWFVDPAGNVHFFIIPTMGTQGSYSSTQALTESLIEDMNIEDVYTGIYNVTAVVGGSLDGVDQHNEAFSSNVATQGTYYAVQFVAGQVSLDNIGLYVYKIQTSGLVAVVPLAGEIRLDAGYVPGGSSNTPQGGPTIANWQATGDQVPNGSGNQTWVTIPCSADLQPGNKYWLIVYATAQNPAEPNDEYYIGTGGSMLQATSTNGTSWTPSTAAAINFRTYFAEQILAIPADMSSVAKYGPRETCITDTTIASPRWAMIDAQAYLNILAKRKRILTIDSVAPDTIITPGQSVYVQDTSRGVTGWFVALDITYNIQDVSCFEANYTLAAYLP